MNSLGHIRIEDNEVWFEYYELEKPDRNNYIEYGEYKKEQEFINIDLYNRDLREYQASKREVKVENVYWNTEFYEWWFDPENNNEPEGKVKHNQPCEAEVENGIATILKIL